MVDWRAASGNSPPRLHGTGRQEKGAGPSWSLQGCDEGTQPQVTVWVSWPQAEVETDNKTSAGWSYTPPDAHQGELWTRTMGASLSWKPKWQRWEKGGGRNAEII